MWQVIWIENVLAAQAYSVVSPGLWEDEGIGRMISRCGISISKQKLFSTIKRGRLGSIVNGSA